MKKLKTTPWFSGNEKPLSDRIGPYERDYSKNENGSVVGWRWWDGKIFGPICDTPELAELAQNTGCSVFQNLPWRGVLK